MKKLIRIWQLWLLLLAAVANDGLTAEKPYVILISFDGFRWDYVDRGLTPNLALMRHTGVSALSLRPCFPSSTFPNHYSIVTGNYPENHGLIQNYFADPLTHATYMMSDSLAVSDSRWYLGEAFWETAERQGIVCASYFWPGSEQNLPYRRPTYFEHYEHRRPYLRRIQGVLQWLQLPEERRPHFITLYFDATDTQGHRYGPDAPETDRAIAQLDSLVGVLRSGLKTIGLLDKTNIILVSDHGMIAADSSRVINTDAILGDLTCDTFGSNPVFMLFPQQAPVEVVYEKLARQAAHYTVYKKATMPSYFHFSQHPFIAPIVVLADPGWSLVTDKRPQYRGKGVHGYDNNLVDMHGIFIASGPAFKSGYRVGTVDNVDIYPLLCAIFGVTPRQNIDGRLERLQPVLR